MLIPVILSGGAGTRLWPVSREGCPKPFMKLADGDSLLKKTYLRAAGVADAGEIITVTHRDYYFLSKDEFEQATIVSGHVGRYMLEPMGRNTAPAVALAALDVAERYGREAMMLVLAADHLVQDQTGFARSVQDACELAGQDQLVTFGIVPYRPDTGFGYIEAEESIGPGHRVRRFVEKPNADKAREYLETGGFYWNAGMFCFKAGVLLDSLALHAVEVDQASRACWAGMEEVKGGSTLREIPAKAFSSVPDISIDYAVMEHADNVAVVPARFDWSDIGSWSAISELVPADGENNRTTTHQSIFVDTTNTFIQSENRLVAAVGVEDLIIVDTPDALLVAKSDKSQEVKQVVATLKARGHEAYRTHRATCRPWGSYTVLEEGARFKIKRVEVKPGQSLSLQAHYHRSEHWVVVSGMARVVNGSDEIFVQPNESTYIPAGQRHRLENPGKLNLVLIEVQCGDYVGEDDIVRYEDHYGRVRES